jgi:hypothetical protein
MSDSKATIQISVNEEDGSYSVDLIGGEDSTARYIAEEIMDCAYHESNGIYAHYTVNTEH